MYKHFVTICGIHCIWKWDTIHLKIYYENILIQGQSFYTKYNFETVHKLETTDVIILQELEIFLKTRIIFQIIPLFSTRTPVH
jgi:hypothetical protein